MPFFSRQTRAVTRNEKVKRTLSHSLTHTCLLGCSRSVCGSGSSTTNTKTNYITTQHGFFFGGGVRSVGGLGGDIISGWVGHTGPTWSEEEQRDLLSRRPDKTASPLIPPPSQTLLCLSLSLSSVCQGVFSSSSSPQQPSNLTSPAQPSLAALH